MSDPAGVKVSLQEDGALWVINRTVFHPRGFALSVLPDTGELFLLGDGTEPWDYALNTPGSIDQDAKFLAFEALLDRARTENVHQATGVKVGDNATHERSP